jgi:hypothetical protein
MIAAFALALALAAQDRTVPFQIPKPYDDVDIRAILNDGSGMFWIHGKPTVNPKLSPKLFGTPPKPIEFDYHTDAFTHLVGDPGFYHARFEIYSENSTRNKSFGKDAAYQLLVMHELLVKRLHLDHKEDVNEFTVDVYLCEGGTAGGEQLFQVDPQTNRSADTIFIYDVAHFDGPMEKARELAHEYGHAVIPAIGGFKAPEYWANGYLGEKLFLRWGLEGMHKGELGEMDFMGVSQVMLEYWVSHNVTPLERDAATRNPTSPLYGEKNKAAMGAFEGLALWCDTIMPPKMFSRSLVLIGSTQASDYPESCVAAAEENTYKPAIPGYLKGQAVWIPIGHGKVTGGTVLQTRLGWAQVKPTGDLTVVEPPVSD